MSLRWRIAIGYALVALATAAVIAIAAPPIITQGFSDYDNDEDALGPAATVVATPASGAEIEDEGAATTAGTQGAGGQGQGAGAQGQGRPGGPPADPGAKQTTILRLILAALAAAAVASLLGLVATSRLVKPLTHLEGAAAGVARGDLAQRSGLADRNDEFGQLGRTFDSMAGQLQRAEEMRRRFLQDAAHELKTPLAVIEATSSAIIDGVYPPETRHVETIRDQSRILARIVDDLRTISLAEGGHLPLERRPLDAATLLRSVAGGFEARASEQSVALKVDAPAGLTVDADEDRLRQMVGALVDNALRHVPAGAGIRLTASRSRPPSGAGQSPGWGRHRPRGPEPAGRTEAGSGAGARGTAAPETAGSGIPAPASRGFVRLAVEDDGPGFPPEAVGRIFERFYQADPSRSRGTGTSGLGLSIVRALAEAHGGQAGAENRLDGGARIWIDLPAVP
jgi:two-component system sensor histidine kinase BaeS